MYTAKLNVGVVMKFCQVRKIDKRVFIEEEGFNKGLEKAEEN